MIFFLAQIVVLLAKYLILRAGNRKSFASVMNAELSRQREDSLMMLAVFGHQIKIIRRGLHIEISHRSLTLVPPYHSDRDAFNGKIT